MEWLRAAIHRYTRRKQERQDSSPQNWREDMTLINLLKGWPSKSLLPTALVQAAAKKALSDPNVSIPGLLYGPDWGYEPLREQLSLWLTSFYKPHTTIESKRLAITGGASQNLACLLQVYTDPVYTRNIWMVSPTYFLACRIFEDSGFQGRLRAIPEDEAGIDIAYLRDALKRSEEDAAQNGNNEPKMKPARPWNKIYRHIIYAVPTFANPSSKTMTLQRRQELVTVAREYDALVITDDVYDQLQWESKPSPASKSKPETAVQPRIVDVDRFFDGGTNRPGADGFGNAVSNGSFSKIVGPGCRTGWAEGTPKLAYGLSQCGSSRSGGAPSQFTATIMSSLIESGDLQRHIIDTLAPGYARRYEQIMSAVEKYLLPLGITLPQTNRDIIGGFFIWVSLPEPLDADEIASRCREENVIVAQGSLFAVYGNTDVVDLTKGIRLCFAWEDEELLVDGVRKIGLVVQRKLEELKSNMEPSEWYEVKATDVSSFQ